MDTPVATTTVCELPTLAMELVMEFAAHHSAMSARNMVRALGGVHPEWARRARRMLLPLPLPGTKRWCCVCMKRLQPGWDLAIRPAACNRLIAEAGLNAGRRPFDCRYGPAARMCADCAWARVRMGGLSLDLDRAVATVCLLVPNIVPRLSAETLRAVCVKLLPSTAHAFPISYVMLAAISLRRSSEVSMRNLQHDPSQRGENGGRMEVHEALGRLECILTVQTNALFCIMGIPPHTETFRMSEWAARNLTYWYAAGVRQGGWHGISESDIWVSREL